MCYLLLLWGWLGVTNCSGGQMPLEGQWEGIAMTNVGDYHEGEYYYYYLLNDGIIFRCHASAEESATTNTLTAFRCEPIP